MNYIQFNDKNSEQKFNKKHFIYIVSRVHYALQLIYWLRLEREENKQPAMKKALGMRKEATGKERKGNIMYR